MAKLFDLQRWIRDVKILQNILCVRCLYWFVGIDLCPCSHPNLPQMVGFSAEECPTPFILLANGIAALSIPDILC